MANFAAEVREFERLLGGLNQALRSVQVGGGRAGSGVVGGVGAGGPFLASGGPAGAALAAAGVAWRGINAAAGFATPAANAYAVTGSSAALAASVTQGALSAVGNTSIGGFALALTGVSAANEVNQSAASRVKSITGDLARFGVEVSDDQRKRLFSEAAAQERRRQKEEAKVDALAGSAESLRQSRPDGAGAGFDRMVAILERIETAMRSFGGGRAT